MIFDARFQKLIDEYKSQNLYRNFTTLTRIKNHYPLSKYNKSSILNLSSNDPLNRGENPNVIKVIESTLHSHGAGSGGTRNISGNTLFHEKLENELAMHHSKQKSLLFTSAYVANEWSLIALSKIIEDCVFFSDSENHASLIQGIRHSNKKYHIWKHNDIIDLKNKLIDNKNNGTPIIVLESLYSMSGERSPLFDIVDIAEEFNALIFLDEVHSVGIIGCNAQGVSEDLGISKKIDIISGTLGKGWGLQGGYIVGHTAVVDAIRCIASGFIFTTSLSPLICAGAIESIKQSRKDLYLREKLRKNASYFRFYLRNLGFSINHNSYDHIIPLFIGNEEKCVKISNDLLENHGIYLTPIRWPTVPKNQSMMRLIPNVKLEEYEIKQISNKIKKVYDYYI